MLKYYKGKDRNLKKISNVDKVYCDICGRDTSSGFSDVFTNTMQKKYGVGTMADTFEELHSNRNQLCKDCLAKEINMTNLME